MRGIYGSKRIEWCTEVLNPGDGKRDILFSAPSDPDNRCAGESHGIRTRGLWDKGQVRRAQVSIELSEGRVSSYLA